MLTDGDLTVTTIFDKPDTPQGPTFEETLLVTPSRLAQPILSEALRAAERAAGALGLRYGPIHAELRLDARNHRRQPTMLELAARSIGGLCSRALRFLDGVSLEQLVLANALGRQVTPHRLARPAGVLMLPVERAGVLQAVHGTARAAAIAGITGLSITTPVGQTVHPLPEGDRYLGFLFAEGATHLEVEGRSTPPASGCASSSGRRLRHLASPVALDLSGCGTQRNAHHRQDQVDASERLQACEDARLELIFEQAELHGCACRFGAGATAELGQDIADVHVDGARAEEQLSGDLAVGAPDRDKAQHLELTS